MRRIFGSTSTERAKPLRLSGFAHLFPIGVIAILQPSRGVAAYGLQMRALILGVADILVGRRHGKGGEALDDRFVA